MMRYIKDDDDNDTEMMYRLSGYWVRSKLPEKVDDTPTFL